VAGGSGEIGGWRSVSSHGDLELPVVPRLSALAASRFCLVVACGVVFLAVMFDV
jgi:hypothetical protein